MKYYVEIRGNGIKLDTNYMSKEDAENYVREFKNNNELFYTFKNIGGYGGVSESTVNVTDIKSVNVMLF